MYNIFIVDDDTAYLAMMKKIIERHNYSVDIFPRGYAALDAIKQKTPDMIILDLMLPDIEGMAICKILKEDPATSSIPIIMVTARRFNETMITGLKTGADDYITKPFEP